jgi:hypothetical protein
VSRADEHEPDPVVNNNPAIQDLVADDLANDAYYTGGQSTHVVRQLIDDVEARKELGVKKYGTVLQAFNGRNVKMDLYQELLDAIFYAKQGCIEFPEDTELELAYRTLVQLACGLIE